MKRHLLQALIVGIFITGSALPPASAVHASCGVLSPGTWTGTFTRNLTVQKSISGVNIAAQGSTTGSFNLNVTCDAITGTLDNVKSDFAYQITGLAEKSDSCSMTRTIDITSGSVTLENGNPKITLDYSAPAGPGLCGQDSPATSASMNLLSETPNGNHLYGNTLEFTDPNIQMALDQLIKIGADVETTAHWELNSSGPAVGEITPQYVHSFLQGIPLQNQYTAPVEWNDLTPGKVTFALNGETRDGTLNGNTAVQTFELGGLPAGKNPLTVVAVAGNGSTSAPASQDVIIVPQPQWAQSAGFTGAPDGDHILYSGKVNFPEKPLQGAVSIPGMIPFLGGTWGLLPTQLTANLKATSAGGIQNGTFTGKGGFGLGGMQFPLDVSGATYTEMSETELSFDKSTAYLSVPPASFSKQVGLLTLIPGADALFSLPVIGKALESMNSLASITGSVTTSVNGQADVEPKADQSELAISSGKISTTAQVQVAAGLDFGLAWAAMQGGGTGSVTYQVVPEVKATDCSVNLNFSAAAGLAKFFGVQPAVYSKDWPLTQCDSSAFTGRKGLASTRYVPMEAVSTTQPQAGTGDEIVLEKNADAHARPVLAVAPDGAMAYTWMAVSQSTSSVMLRTASDGSWSQPISLSGSSAPAFTPAVGIDSNGMDVAVWVQAKDSTVPSTLTEDYARGMEIKYAAVDPASGKITRQGALTDDNDLDFTPQIARGSDGSLWAAWQSSPSASLAGTKDSPNRLLAARWDGKQWSKVETAADNLAGTLYWNLAAGGKSALIAYDADTDGDLSTAADREIFAVESGAHWGKPQQVTKNNAADSAPRAAYAPDGTLALAWLSGQTVMGVTGKLNAEPSVWLDPAQTTLGLQLNGGVLLAGAEGRLALVLPGASTAGPDVWLVSYDPTAKKWNLPTQPVFNTAEAESAISAGQTADGSVWISAARTPVDQQAADQIAGSGSTADLVLTQEKDVFPVSSGENPSNGGILWIVLGAVGGLAVAGGVGYALLRKKK
jgi:hypothetical protein